MSRSYWLYKTEPSTYSYAQLEKDGKTHWDGVRNYQARNHLKAAKVGDRVLIYHSVSERSIVGVAEIIREAYPESTSDQGDWVQVELKPLKKLKTPVTLDQIKAEPQFKDLGLIRQSRLSVMPVPSDQFQALMKLGGIEK